MINASRNKSLHFFTPFLSISHSKSRWVSSISPKDHRDHLRAFFLDPMVNEFALVSALKSCSNLSAIAQGEQIHSLALKSGFQSNLFVRNSLMNLYVKCQRVETARLMFDSSDSSLDSASWNIMICGYVKLGRLDDAVQLFEKMPERDCVSFTTMIMGFTQNDRLIEAFEVFKEMRVTGVAPNEVTLASLISACSHLHLIQDGNAFHAVAIKGGLEEFVLVSTNLVHMYAVCSSLSDARAIFDEIPERNIVTWNVMLNGYAKAGLIDSARDFFERIPVRDLVSWGTMIDGYVQGDRLVEALLTYREMQRAELRPNEVTIVDLVSACARVSAIDEGRQFHGIILKTGLDGHPFIEATIIHFYAACHQIDLACSQFQMSDTDNVSSWNALITGFVRNNMVESAKELFNEMPEKDVVSWSSMIAGYAQSRQFDLALDLFHAMQVRGLHPNEITMVSVLSAVANSGTLKQGKWIHDYIHKNSIPFNDKLSAGLIDMYAKRGSIERALQLFNQVRDKAVSVSPWTAIICGLAMHGYADMSLRIFSELQKTEIKPNSITFIGILSSCCHAGLVEMGGQIFECMKSIYNIEPNIKHYGCMVDLLGRAGRLKEAERLIESMPMKADIVIWGSMLAASRTHGNVDIGERAAENLARLEPGHGAGRVLLSNIYAEAGRWDDVFQVRRAMQSKKMKKLPGCSGVM